jgi:hypothetical protein
MSDRNTPAPVSRPGEDFFLNERDDDVNNNNNNVRKGKGPSTTPFNAQWEHADFAKKTPAGNAANECTIGNRNYIMSDPQLMGLVKLAEHNPNTGDYIDVNNRQIVQRAGPSKRTYEEALAEYGDQDINDPCAGGLSRLRAKIRETKTRDTHNILQDMKTNLRDDWIRTRLPLYEVEIKGRSLGEETAQKYVFKTYTRLIEFLDIIYKQLSTNLNSIDIHVIMHETVPEACAVYDSLSVECIAQADDPQAAMIHVRKMFVAPHRTRRGYITAMKVKKNKDGSPPTHAQIKKAMAKARDYMERAISKY